jgi:hypothetical protein
MMALIVWDAVAKPRQQDRRRVAEQRLRCQLQGHPHPAGRRTDPGARS